MKNILVTGIGGELGQSISRVIADAFKSFDVYGTDLNYLNSGKLFCKEMYLLPKAEDNNYINSLKDLLLELRIDLIIPSTDQEREIISKFISNNCFFNTQVLGCFDEIFSIGNDKLITAKWLSSIGLEVPKTYLLSEIFQKLDNLFFENNKYILKKRQGSGSRHIYEIEKTSQIPEWIYQDSKDWIIQEFIPEDEGEYTVAVSILDNKHKHIQLKRILDCGSTGYAEVIENPKITELVKKICGNLKTKLAFNLQLRFKKGIPMIFEINPRFSSTVYARHLLGFPDLAEWINYSLNLKESIKFKFHIGSKFYRYFNYEVEN